MHRSSSTRRVASSQQHYKPRRSKLSSTHVSRRHVVASCTPRRGITSNYTTRISPSSKLVTTARRHSSTQSPAPQQPLSILSLPGQADLTAPIFTELHGNVLQINFNRPQVFNAMTDEMGVALASIVEQVKQDQGKHVKAVVLTGQGRAFSAGGDFTFLKARNVDSPTGNISAMLRFYKEFMSLRELPVPSIAAINGPAVGAGACVSLLCDYRIASSKAKMGFAFTGLGLHPGMGSTFYLPKLTTHASHLLYSGDLFSAREAKDFNIVHQVVDVPSSSSDDENNALLLAEATKLAHAYAEKYSPAIFTLVKTLRAQQDVGLQSALLREAESQASCFNSPEYTERLDAMINRKKH